MFNWINDLKLDDGWGYSLLNYYYLRKWLSSKDEPDWWTMTMEKNGETK